MKEFLIAVIDDEAELLDLYKNMLRSESHIETFSNPESFLKRLEDQNFKPDIVITDYTMPGVNGVEMIRMAKSLGKSFYSILISGYLDKEKVIEATNIGDFYVLEKPASRQAILSAVNGFLLEAKFARIKKDSDTTKKKIQELFDLFRLLCVDELELKVANKAQLIPTEKSERVMNLDEAIYQLESDLADLSVSEQKLISELIKKRKNMKVA